ncbi:MAG: hypothetical protein GC191_03800 [Azospirillum sp.]|nr:hypothetical protein [Azospirillum sp.]
MADPTPVTVVPPPEQAVQQLGAATGTLAEKVGEAYEAVKEVTIRTVDAAGAVATTCQQGFTVKWDDLWNQPLRQVGSELLSAVSTCAEAVGQSVKALISVTF